MKFKLATALRVSCRLAVFAGMAMIATKGGAALRVENPKCEFQDNPLGIDRPTPRFDWQLSSNARGDLQTAYQVLVATDHELLAPGKADLWDSGKQLTSSTLQIAYAGKRLASNQQAYWIVRSWDQADAPSEWSRPATFTTAILDPAQWQAQWIGTQADQEKSPDLIEEANWVWSQELQDEKDPGYKPGKPASGAVRYFRKDFDLPADALVNKSSITFTGDNDVELYLNGEKIASHDDWKHIKEVAPAAGLVAGKVNHLGVRVKNTGGEANSAGMILAVRVPLKSGGVVEVVSDATWKGSRAADGPAWTEQVTAAGKEEADWHPVRVLGKMGVNPWNKVSRGDPPVIPIFRKEFAVTKPVKRALVHATGLGHYVLSVNGKKAGDHFLDPPWSKYEKTIFYNTFDVTESLNNGDNAIGVMLGKGFYNTAGDRRIHGAHYDRCLAVLLQAHLEFEDGTTSTIVSDATWKWTQGPLIHNAILGGTDFDARKLADGWDTPGFNDSEWVPAHQLKAPGATLKAAFAPPMRPFQEMAPKSVEEPEPGHFVYDFGQNSSATPRLTVSGKPGQTIKLTWAEQRKGQSPFTNNGKGVVDQSGIGNGWITYTLRGGSEDEKWFCDLFYTGFQYLKLTGGVPHGHPNPEGKPVVKELVSVHVHTDEPPVGTFSTSNDMYNRIDRMIDWAVRSNLGHVFTDCPTREKLGWLEVPWLMWASVASRYDMAAFGEKIAADIRDSQLPDGQILTVAPSYPNFQGGFHYTAEWGAAGVFVPWYTYEWYADKSALDSNYAMMKGFVDYLSSTSTNLIAAPGLGDWYDYWPGEPLGPSRFTPTELTATAVFAGCADIVSSSAAILGKADDQKKYADLAADIRQEFNKRFRKGPGLYEHTSSPQTANAMALVFDMVPEEERATAAQVIVDDLEARQWQQTSGDVGYRFLINALTQTGHSDVIFKVLNRDKIGSYSYLVNSGWTSLPEAWNASPTSSMNHCMLGHIQEWFSQHLLGIAPAPGSVGFDKVLIQPTPGEGVTSATGILNSPRGEIAVAWEQQEGRFTCEFSIPANSSATVRLPVPAGATITEAGKSLFPDNLAVKRVGHVGDREILEVASGSYKIEASY